jgi:PEP-CTERM motif
MKKTLLFLGICALAVSAQASLIINPSFEIPSLGAGNYSYNTSGATWVFANHSGEAATGSPWFSGSPPDGTQAAFLQNLVGDAAGSDSISQSLGLSIGTLYQFTVSAALRPGYNADPFTVFLDSNNLGTFTPLSTTFATFTTAPVTATSATMTLSFVAAGASPNDITSVIDNVGVLTPAIPEPGSFVLLGAGLLALGSMFKLKRRN